jgi:hypothetical protein
MTTPILSCIEEVSACRDAKQVPASLTIRCYVFSSLTYSPTPAHRMDRSLVAQAMTLLMQIDGEVRLARADWNDDRFRRLMRLRPKAVRRLQRRWAKLVYEPRTVLGSLRRRYHANIAGYLNSVSQD